jgi:hypothetical protein
MWLNYKLKTSLYEKEIERIEIYLGNTGKGWMITLNLARKLKQNGFRWEPALHDFFAIPERGMDERVFVITDIPANIEKILGSQVVAFQGTSEWALDYLVTSEAVWLPSEEQLRQALLERISQEGEDRLRLECTPQTCICRLVFRGQGLHFEEKTGAQAYGAALLHLLEISPQDGQAGDDQDRDIWEAGFGANQES